MNEKVKTFISDKLVGLKDDLQHYSMVEKDKVKERLLTLEIKDFNNVLGALNNLEELIKDKDEHIAKILNDNKILRNENKSLTKTIAQLTEADYYFITSMALDMLKGNSNFALMYVDNIFCLVDTKDNSFDVIDNYDIDTENIGKSKCQELNELREFTKLVSEKNVDIPVIKDTDDTALYLANVRLPTSLKRQLTPTEFCFIKKVVEKYGN